MPNHVANILTVKGTPEQVKEVMDILVNENGNITFDKFAPMPEDLVKVTSPVSVVSQKEYDEKKAELERKLASGESVWSTTLPITKKMQKEYIEKYGVDNWYDWAKLNWGTKWGAYDGYKIDDNTVFFQTAWNTPVNAMITLSEKFPEVVINVQYADEDFGHNVGEYDVQGAEIIKENVPKGGSLEAIEMALDIQGGEDYYLGDNIHDMSEDELEDSWYNKFLQVIVKREYIDENYPTFVNEYLLNLAVDNEQLEYASKLRDVLKVEN